MKKQKIIVTITLLFTLILFQATAQEDITQKYRWGIQTAYYFPNQNGLTGGSSFAPVSYATAIKPGIFPVGDDVGRNLGNGWGALELQTWADYSLTIPFLQGNSSMTKDNNLKINEKINLSPATIGSTTTFTLTPIAFLKFEQGNHLGTGWNVGIANGLGLNIDGTGTPATSAIPGVVYKGWLAGTFQFDLSAVLSEPGDWSHIVVQSTAKIQYQVFTAASINQSWQYEADSGMNYNGFKLYTTNLLGVMVPNPIINFAGFMVETNVNIFDNANISTLASGGWGSDFIGIQLGPMANWQIDENNGITFLVQFHNAPEYTADTVYYNFFQNRHSTGNSYFYFDRIALAYTMNL